MAFYTLPYRVLFHDTMAYGTHHFLTNFRFQCEAREHLFFERIVDDSPEGRAAHENLIILTREGYSRNLAPVECGGRVGILLSFEEPGPSSTRFCFRVIRDDGVPVCAGYQSIVCISKATGQITPAPPKLIAFTTPLLEKLQNPSFKDRLHNNRLDDIFDPAAIALGKAVAQESEHGGDRFREAPIVASETRAPELESTRATRRPMVLGKKPRLSRAFLFPGQGAYEPSLLRRWAAEEPFRDILERADHLAGELLGGSILELVRADEEEHARRLYANPDLAQVVMFLNAALVAQGLQRRGVPSSLMVGHSAGEIAALCAAGAFDILTGAEIIARRVLALRSLPRGLGGMLGVYASPTIIEDLLSSIPQTSLAVAVVNHAEQSVVSGPFGELEGLERAAHARGLRTARIQSPYPFHNPLLAAAVEPFAAALRRVAFQPLHTPVYSPIEKGWLESGPELAEILASHFVRPLSFEEAVREVRALGAEAWIECGGRKVLPKLVRRILVQDPIRLYSPGAKGGEAVESELDAVAAAETKSPAASEAPARPAAEPRAVSAPDTGGATEEPIAIVSLGCVLPGAHSVDEFWTSLMERRSGVSDAGDFEPDVRRDFWAPGRPTPDKTYTLLGGFVRGFDPDLEGLPWTREDFARLPAAQRFLAAALREAGGVGWSGRGLVTLGATCDGVVETDESLVAAGLAELAASLQASPQESSELIAAIEGALGRGRSPDVSSPYAGYASVVEGMLGAGVEVQAVDAACASSLYALDLGVRALRRGDKDWALCGGVFAPGPANSCLFSQFLGLSVRGSRPLDAEADGVVFGEGAAILGLQRLSDALAGKRKIYGLIRSIGTSSDGKSPSVAVPKRKGQVLALKRAWERAGLDPASAQYIEAHATSTTVGDAVEFSALKEYFGPRVAPGSVIGLGSVKALLGHTGWTAGAASLIKMCKAMEQKTLPPQPNFQSPNPKIDLEASPFAIATEPSPWPEPGAGTPMRVGVSGFGFGGSNAHVILDAYEPSIHKAPATSVSEPRSRRVAIVALGERRPRSGARFSDAELALPRGLLVMPDVIDHMDRSQALAVQAAHAALQATGEAWKGLRERIGVVLGLTGKTELSLRINKRLYLDRIKNRLAEDKSAAVQRWLPALEEKVKETPASGPYTLPGLMPNVSAGRVANLLNLCGPNLVLDTGESSLHAALQHGAELILDDTCALVLAGAVNAAAMAEYARPGRRLCEGAALLALTSPETAREQGIEVIGFLELGGEEAGAPRRVGQHPSGIALRGADGAIELIEGLGEARRGKTAVISWGAGRKLRIAPAQSPAPPARDGFAPPARDDERPFEKEITPRNRRPIYKTCPRWQALAPRPSARFLSGKRVLVLCDQPRLLGALGPAVAARELKVLMPARDSAGGATAIDLSDDGAARSALADLDPEAWDAVLVVKDLAAGGGFESVAREAGGGGLLELMFIVARHLRLGLAEGRIAFGALCFKALDSGGKALPYTGLTGGFVKSIARQFPEATCRAVSTSAADLAEALAQINAELAPGAEPEVEVLLRDGLRGALRLSELPGLSEPGEPLVDASSVVLVTGGARGVTAVLVEEVMRRFGCAVAVLGRTDPGRASEEVVALSDEEFEAYQTRYYSEGRRREPGVKIKELKRRFESLRASREVARNLRRQAALGRSTYLMADVQGPVSVERAVRSVLEEHGRLDLIVHGAGVQISGSIERKALGDFRRVMGTKLGGLRALRSAVKTLIPDREVHMHLLTSAFSFFGNDGQEDYGAANESMNRLAEAMNARADEGVWTSLAWLGWIGVGMTRASEYVALAKARGLRALRSAEGQAIFADLLSGPPRSAVNVLAADGELEWYDIPVTRLGAESGESEEEPRVSPVALSLAEAPYLLDHRVRDVPTLPGTFEIELASKACAARSPGWRVVGLTEARFERFVKVREAAPDHLRVETRLVSSAGNERLIATRLLSDFVHASGRVLERGVEHFSCCIRLQREPAPLARLGVPHPEGGGPRIPDPYLLADSLRLDGMFRCLHGIELGPRGQRALFRIEDGGRLASIDDFLIPSVLLDALCRLSMMHRDEAGGQAPIYVPLSCGESWFAAGVNDRALFDRGAPLLLTTAAPKLDAKGQIIRCDWVQAEDAGGQIIASIRGLAARRVGEVALVS